MRRTRTSRGLTLTRRQMIGVAGALAATCLFSGTRAARAEGADEKPAGSPSDSEGALFAARARDDSGSPNLWGFIDATGAWVIEPQFEDVASEPGPSYDVGAGVSPLETVYDALYTECMGLTPGVFDGSAWVFGGVDESSSSVTYENLVGVYDIEDEGGECVTSLEITDVAADGTITARVSWRLDQPRLIYLTLFAPEDAATLTGKLVSAPSEEGRHRVIANLSGTTDTEGLPAAMSILADSDPVGLSGGDTEIEYNLIVEAQTKNRNRGTVDDLYSYQFEDYASLLTDEKLSKDAVSGE